MKKFKKGQVVYYFLETGEFKGCIIPCEVLKATFDLTTKQVIYTVSSNGFILTDTKELTADYLYNTYKAAVKDHREELVYEELSSRINRLNDLLEEVINRYEENIREDIDHPYFIANISPTVSTLVVNNTDMYAEILVLKKEIEEIKAKIPKPRKKPVKEENKKNKSESVDIVK